MNYCNEGSQVLDPDALVPDGGWALSVSGTHAAKRGRHASRNISDFTLLDSTNHTAKFVTMGCVVSVSKPPVTIINRKAVA